MSKKPRQHKINGHTLPQFIAFLNETLIPDLKESGRDATAEDFESAVKWIEFVGDQQTAALATLKKLRDAAVNTPALDSSKDWTDLITEADRVRGARLVAVAPVKPAPDVLGDLEWIIKRLERGGAAAQMDAIDQIRHVMTRLKP